MKIVTIVLLSFAIWEPHQKTILALMARARKSPEYMIGQEKKSALGSCETHADKTNVTASDLEFPFSRQAFFRPEH